MIFQFHRYAVSHIPSHSFMRVANDISRTLNIPIVDYMNMFVYGDTLIHISSLIDWQTPFVYPRFRRVLWYVALEYIPFRFYIPPWIKMVTVSKTCARWIKQAFGFEPDVVYHGIDTNPPTNIPLAEMLRKHIGDFVLYIGSNIFRKGIGPLIAAMKMLNEEGAKLKLVLVIHQPGENIKFYRPWPIPRYDWIHVVDIDMLPDEDLHAYYEACRVYVQPSFAEGFGLPPLEASIHKKPVVLAPYDVAYELFKGYRYIVPPKATILEPFAHGIFVYRTYSAKDMANKIWDAYNNPDDHLYDYVANNFSLDTYRKLLDL